MGKKMLWKMQQQEYGNDEKIEKSNTPPLPIVLFNPFVHLHV